MPKVWWEGKKYKKISLSDVPNFLGYFINPRGTENLLNPS